MLRAILHPMEANPMEALFRICSNKMTINHGNVNGLSNQVPKGLDVRKHAFFSYYRKWHPDLYSDSFVTYDVELTEEIGRASCRERV